MTQSTRHCRPTPSPTSQLRTPPPDQCSCHQPRHNPTHSHTTPPPAYLRKCRRWGLAQSTTPSRSTPSPTSHWRNRCKRNQPQHTPTHLHTTPTPAHRWSRRWGFAQSTTPCRPTPSPTSQSHSCSRFPCNQPQHNPTHSHTTPTPAHRSWCRRWGSARLSR